MPKDLTIIVLTYNSKHIIEKNLKNLDFEKYNVVVIDNASKDETADFVKEKFPEAEIIKLSRNIGYGRANNVALKNVNTEFALVLNPDAIISKDSVEAVLQEMKANEKVAIAGPIILAQDDVCEEKISAEKAKIEEDLSTIKDMYYERVGNAFDTRFISGACIFFRMSVFRKIGFFDEKIFMFYEDDEICLRAKKNGYKNLTVPQAVVCHVGASSSKKSWRGAFRRNWHLKGWSKLYWKQVKKGKFSAKKSALRLTLSYFFKSLFSAIKFDSEKLAENSGAFFGSLAFLSGLGAFKTNDTPRG